MNSINIRKVQTNVSEVGMAYFEYEYKGRKIHGDEVCIFTKMMIGATIYFEGEKYKIFGVELHPLPFINEGQKIRLHATIMPKTFDYKYNNTIEKLITYKRL